MLDWQRLYVEMPRHLFPFVVAYRASTLQVRS
jgi:hypothetical protein